MAEHHSVTIRRTTIAFHIYVTHPQSAAKVTALQPFLARLPDEHLSLLYPIFVMNHKPRGGNGGGTWPLAEVSSSFTHTDQINNTGIPLVDIQTYVLTPAQGIIGLTRDRWERPMGYLEFSLLHEVAHVINLRLGLVPHGATDATFAGMNTNRCGDGNMIVRRAVECYARYICRPSAVYHELPEGETAAQANSRLIRALRSSPAFQHVPETWRPN